VNLALRVRKIQRTTIVSSVREARNAIFSSSDGLMNATSYHEAVAVSNRFPYSSPEIENGFSAFRSVDIGFLTGEFRLGGEDTAAKREQQIALSGNQACLFFRL